MRTSRPQKLSLFTCSSKPITALTPAWDSNKQDFKVQCPSMESIFGFFVFEPQA